eukprot:gnl/Dysnectes_brevis/5070_a7135_393.p1 GENE.gnl/Dysnectes_brevis/5070_a7135_393~~gnl/Dysnectes_brevis/5070_a7135_393.p1  ORF type:complete len:448 (-),score=38.23 gnl/Dysnectes_brevis/5070_a7135_393:199-1542(-)
MADENPRVESPEPIRDHKHVRHRSRTFGDLHIEVSGDMDQESDIPRMDDSEESSSNSCSRSNPEIDVADVLHNGTILNCGCEKDACVSMVESPGSVNLSAILYCSVDSKQKSLWNTIREFERQRPKCNPKPVRMGIIPRMNPEKQLEAVNFTFERNLWDCVVHRHRLNQISESVGVSHNYGILATHLHIKTTENPAEEGSAAQILASRLFRSNLEFIRALYAGFSTRIERITAELNDADVDPERHDTLRSYHERYMRWKTASLFLMSVSAHQLALILRGEDTAVREERLQLIQEAIDWKTMLVQPRNTGLLRTSLRAQPLILTQTCLEPGQAMTPQFRARLEQLLGDVQECLSRYEEDATTISKATVTHRLLLAEENAQDVRRAFWVEGLLVFEERGNLWRHPERILAVGPLADEEFNWVLGLTIEWSVRASRHVAALNSLKTSLGL